VDALASSQVLETDFAIPDAAVEVCVRADLKSRSTRISMTLRAPEDRKRPEARLNWLLAQLRNAEADGIEVVANWPGRAKPTYGSLGALRENSKLITDQNAGLSPVSFEVARTCHTPAAFAGRKRFIQDLQVALPAFYSGVGSLLSAWEPKPPPPEEKSAAARIEEVSVIEANRMADLEASLAAVMHSLGSTGSGPDVGSDPAAEAQSPVSPANEPPQG
jgi:hypothetical protein